MDEAVYSIDNVMTLSNISGNDTSGVGRRVTKVLLPIVAVGVIVSNAFVIFAIIKTPALQTSSYKLLASLAVADLLNGVLFLVVNIAVLNHDHRMCLPSHLVPFIRTVVSLLFPLVITATWLTTALITADRYIAIKHSLWHGAIFSTRWCLLFVALSWLYACGLNVAGFLLSGGSATADLRNRACISMDDLNFFLLLPLEYRYFYMSHFLVIFCWIFYSKAATMWTAYSFRRKIASEMWAENPAVLVQLRVIKQVEMVFLVVVVSTVSLMPWVVHSILVQVTDQRFEMLSILRSVGMIVNSAANPILYCWLSSDFRKAFKTLLNMQNCCARAADAIHSIDMVTFNEEAGNELA